jgi:pyruvate kinase
MRHTKIVATSAPPAARRYSCAACSRGVEYLRLNFSHGSHESHAASYAAIRERRGGDRAHVAVMQDLSGPKIRTGPLEGGQP